MANTLKLQVVSPDKPGFATDVTLVNLPGSAGAFGVMAKHMPIMATIRPGTLKVVAGGKSEFYFVSKGFVEVNPKGVTVLAEAYERADEIDAERAKKSKETAQEQLSAKKDAKQHPELQSKLERALGRLKVIEEAKQAGA
jgi:F-type H+-transporting ATPase subunit epsilon